MSISRIQFRHASGQVIPGLLKHDDEPEKRRDGKPAWLETVAPRWTENRRRAIADALACYGMKTCSGFPAAWHQGEATNKSERLSVALWVLGSLPPCSSDTEAVNLLACVIEAVEQKAGRQYLLPGHWRDLKPMRVIRPVPEMRQGQLLQASYSVRHVTLFSPEGAIQVWRLPAFHLGGFGGCDAGTPVATPGQVLFDKPDWQGRHIACMGNSGNLSRKTK